MGFSLKQRIKSFTHAFRGVGTLVKTQHNAWIHLLATVIVVGAGAFFKVDRLDWALLVIAIMVVLITEALNTAIEFVCDAITLEQNPLIGKAKDVAATAVLIASFGAVIIALIVFLPYIRN